MTAPATFSLLDYGIFSLMLGFSCLIGLYYACTGGRQKTTKEWLTGNKELPWIPTSLSLLASFISAITLLGTPSELYVNGTMYLHLAWAYFIVIPITAHLYMPVFRKTGVTSIFEYLNLRFNNSMRLVAAIVYIFQMTIYLAIVLYAPALALCAVTGMSLTVAIISVGSVCSFYTAIGGIKAVIWADSFQTIVMFLGMITVVLFGVFNVGGFTAVWEINKQGHRIIWDDFSLDPRVRHSGLALIIGGAVMWTSVFGVNQVQVQRMVSVPSKRNACKAVYFNLFGMIFVMCLSGFGGSVAYARYALCDPIKEGGIAKGDQILPYFVVDIFRNIPGFSGIFISSIFSGGLSTVSSGVNALGGITLTEILPIFMESFLEDAQEITKAHLAKILALVYGFISILLAFVVGQLGPILQAALSLYGVLCGPLLGVITLGMLVKRANAKGALISYLISITVGVIIMTGSFVYKYTPEKPIAITSHCPIDYYKPMTANEILDDLTHEASFTNATDTSNWPFYANTIFRISYMWYTTITSGIVLIFGIILSTIFNWIENTDQEPKGLWKFRDAFTFDEEDYDIEQIEMAKT